jgi:hypothetical protein
MPPLPPDYSTVADYPGPAAEYRVPPPDTREPARDDPKYPDKYPDRHRAAADDGNGDGHDDGHGAGEPRFPF